MLQENLSLLFERDIRRLQTEINAYRDKNTMWKISGSISNSGGNLSLHLLGNLQYYIGAILGTSGYKRNRPEEFTLKNIPVSEINASIEHTIVLVKQTILSLTEESIGKEYPEKVFDHPMTTEYFLLHLLAHLNYHLGQINYHRRIMNSY